MRLPIIDLQDGPCEICMGWEKASAALEHTPGQLARACARCGERIAVYENMNGAGFASPLAHHWHLAPIPADVPALGRHAVREELCYECYAGAWQDAYPGTNVPPAPRRIGAPAPVTADVADGVLLSTARGMSPEAIALRVERRDPEFGFTMTGSTDGVTASW